MALQSWEHVLLRVQEIETPSNTQGKTTICHSKTTFHVLVSYSYERSVGAGPSKKMLDEFEKVRCSSLLSLTLPNTISIVLASMLQSFPSLMPPSKTNTFQTQFVEINRGCVLLCCGEKHRTRWPLFMASTSVFRGPAPRGYTNYI